MPTRRTARGKARRKATPHRKYNEADAKAFLDALRGGVTLQTALRRVGFGERTLGNWLRAHAGFRLALLEVIRASMSASFPRPPAPGPAADPDATSGRNHQESAPGF